MICDCYFLLVLNVFIMSLYLFNLYVYMLYLYKDNFLSIDFKLYCYVLTTCVTWSTYNNILCVYNIHLIIWDFLGSMYFMLRYPDTVSIHIVILF